MKKIIIAMSFMVSFLIAAIPAFAHVVVKPSEVGAAAFQTFNMGVPNERDNPTISLRLVVPEGLHYVTPNVKPGWTITVSKEGNGEEVRVREITWTGGTIPTGQRDEFLFSAQVPSEETKVIWKAYQTYQDGTVVSWDQDPESIKDLSDEQKEEHEKKGLGPFSQTSIVNNLSDSQADVPSDPIAANSNLSFVLSAIALLGSGYAIWLQMSKRK